jgi:hypothetical protein
MFVIEIIFEADVIIVWSEQTAFFHLHAFASVAGIALTDVF